MSGITEAIKVKKYSYRDYVRSLPCCVSEYVGEEVDPHHIKGYASVVGNSGGKKSSDTTCIPLRHDLHNELHDGGWQSFEAKYNMSQLEELERTRLRAERDGILEVNLEKVKEYV